MACPVTLGFYTQLTVSVTHVIGTFKVQRRGCSRAWSSHSINKWMRVG